MSWEGRSAKLSSILELNMEIQMVDSKLEKFEKATAEIAAKSVFNKKIGETGFWKLGVVPIFTSEETSEYVATIIERYKSAPSYDSNPAEHMRMVGNLDALFSEVDENYILDSYNYEIVMEVLSVL